jgi:hypothetical protein
MSVDTDLAAMLRGWDSKVVAIGTWRGRALVEEVDYLDTDRSGGGVLMRRTVVRIRKADVLTEAGTIPIARGDTVTVDGTAYTVSDVMLGAPGHGQPGGWDIDGRVLDIVVRKV